MGLDHHPGVLSVECFFVDLLQPVDLLLVFRAQPGLEAQASPRCDVQQLLVGLGMVGDHALRVLLDRGVGCPPLSYVSEVLLQEVVSRDLADEEIVRLHIRLQIRFHIRFRNRVRFHVRLHGRLRLRVKRRYGHGHETRQEPASGH